MNSDYSRRGVFMASANNDPFEEFEFRPINEGLGFHRKQKANSLIANSTNQPSKDLQSTQKNSSPLFQSEIIFQSPLPRPETRSRPSFQVPTIEDDSIAKAQTAVNEILKTLNHKRQIDFVNDTAKQKTEYKNSKPQLFASVLDGMLVASAFLLSLIIMLSITKVDLFLNLSHPQTSQMIYVATLALFLSIYFIYMVVNRAFLGFTPGEWAFDQVCGRKGQDDELTFIPKLVFRTVLVAMTGFIILPFLSFLFNKDMAGEISGISLFQKPHA